MDFVYNLEIYRKSTKLDISTIFNARTNVSSVSVYVLTHFCLGSLSHLHKLVTHWTAVAGLKLVSPHPEDLLSRHNLLSSLIARELGENMTGMTENSTTIWVENFSNFLILCVINYNSLFEILISFFFVFILLKISSSW